MLETDVTIATMGHLGDGVSAAAPGEPALFIPFTLPGERVRVKSYGDGRAELQALIEGSPDRVEPPCRHFTRCGGCALQHWADAPYTDWKRAQVEQALASRGIEAEIAPMAVARAHSRRRAGFAVTRAGKGTVLGYYGRASHTIIPVEECPLIVPEIEHAFTLLGQLMEPGLSRKGRASILVTATETGLDVAVTGGKTPLDLPLRELLGTLAAKGDFARLTWDGDMVAERRVPVIDLSGFKVMLPPGGFLQATKEGEQALVARVTRHVQGAKSVADLFAGCGTFSAALVRASSVHAVEGDAPAMKALERALNEQGPLQRARKLTTEIRDLFRRPLLPAELNRFEAVVFDPPRAGAKAQAEEIARSKVQTVVAVSCNPATFARDARTLIDGGYRLDIVEPVDQFLWSPHIELVACFSKG
ncbi:MAG: class I SAM-dependent RNA methyltransferase [Parvibaculaceae bacterium]|nr:class I SAM-dependent RNA methyltransferase [Parvibaculaceae bacterium]